MAQTIPGHTYRPTICCQPDYSPTKTFIRDISWDQVQELLSQLPHKFTGFNYSVDGDVWYGFGWRANLCELDDTLVIEHLLYSDD